MVPILFTIEGSREPLDFPISSINDTTSRGTRRDNGLSSMLTHFDWHARPEAKANVFDQDDPTRAEDPLGSLARIRYPLSSRSPRFLTFERYEQKYLTIQTKRSMLWVSGKVSVITICVGTRFLFSSQFLRHLCFYKKESYKGKLLFRVTVQSTKVLILSF